MKTLDLMPGTQEWLAARSRYRCASDAPAMMGVSKNETRNQLLARLKSGAPKEFSDYVQELVINPGHETEAAARPIAAEIIGQTLYPLVVVDDADYVLASLDGQTMDDEIIWEHKRWNEESAALVREGICPPWHLWQVVQALYITGAKKCLFMVSDGTKENCAWTWVEPNPADFLRLLDGWAQFDKDHEAFQPVEVLDKPEAKPIERLPALAVLVKGEIVASNLPEFKAAAEAYIAGINTELTTDQHFADAIADAKFCREMADKVELTIESALAQVSSIDELVRVGRALAELFDKKGLLLEKKVKTENDAIRAKKVAEGQTKFKAHIDEINTELSPMRIAAEVPDFWEAVKNKRTVESLQNAVDTLLSNAKIAADTMARDYRAKLAWINVNGKGYAYPDLQALLAKPVEDFQLTIQARIKRIEDDAERVRKEKEAAAVTQPAPPAPVAQPATATVRQVVQPLFPSTTPRAAAPSTPPTLKLGQIGERLGFAGCPLNVTADFLKNLGFESAARDKNALLFHEATLPLICAALIDHIGQVQAKQAA